MTDDIVTRLRRMDASIPSVDPDKYVSPTEAADEIERLLAEITRQDAEILEINLLWNADKAKLEALLDV